MNLNVDDSTDSYPAITSTSMSHGKLQASDPRPKCRPRGTMAPLVLLGTMGPLLGIALALTTFFSSMVYISFTSNHDDLAMLYKNAEVYRGGKRACLPSGIQGLLYTSGNAQALPVLVLVAAWILAIHPLRAFTLTADRRLHACHTFAVMLPCAALVTLQPLVIISWAAFGGEMKSWEFEGRPHDRETPAQSEAQSDATLEGGYECYASRLLLWGSQQTVAAQFSCVCGIVACAWYLLLGACFKVMPSKPRLLRAVFGQLPDDDGQDLHVQVDVAAAAADISEERVCMAKDSDSVAKDPDSVAHVADPLVEDGVKRTGAPEAS